MQGASVGHRRCIAGQGMRREWCVLLYIERLMVFPMKS